MDPKDRDAEVAVCASCGAEVDPGAEPGCAFGTGNQLCWSCAGQRGGRYDADRDVWERAPDLAGLADEAYGSAPHERRRVRRHG